MAFGFTAAYIVGGFVGTILPLAGPGWAVGVGAVVWGVLSVLLLLVHALWWHCRRRGETRRPGAWTRALERGGVPATVGSIAVGGVGATIAIAAEVDSPVVPTVKALGAVYGAVMVVVLAWYGTVAWRVWRGGGDARNAVGAPGAPAAEWIGGPVAALRDHLPR